MRCMRVISTVPVAAAIVCCPSSSYAHDGSIVGRGSMVVGADLSGDFVAVEGGDCHSPGLKGTPSCPADVNGDGFVDVTDLLAVLAAWGNTSGPEDVNGDGIVNVQDLLELLAAWGPCA